MQIKKKDMLRNVPRKNMSRKFMQNSKIGINVKKAH